MHSKISLRFVLSISLVVGALLLAVEAWAFVLGVFVSSKCLHLANPGASSTHWVITTSGSSGYLLNTDTGQVWTLTPATKVPIESADPLQKLLREFPVQPTDPLQKLLRDLRSQYHQP